MIRRRPQNSMLYSHDDGTTPEEIIGYDVVENDDKKGDNFYSRSRCLLLKCDLIATVAVFIFCLFEIANYIDTTNAPGLYNEPNNLVDKMAGSSSERGNMVNEHEAEELGLGISDVPYVRYEPMNFKAIKARMDHAGSIGAAVDPNNPNNTVGQYLLDFGIIGFPKCGTTTMMKWLNMHENVAVLDYEITALQKYHPARILHYIIRDLPEGRFRRGYKSPSDVGDGRARNKLSVHYGKTKLLVGLRHPVLWYESFYNHRVQNGYEMTDLAKELAKKKSNKVYFACSGAFKGVCFSRASFHTTLAKWGKTPLLFLPPENEADPINSKFDYSQYNSDDEWALFSKADKQSLKNEVNKTEISPNPIFLYDVSQLRIPKEIGGSEKVKADQNFREFVLSLQAFLGLPQNFSAMPPMIRESPGRKDGITAAEQLQRNRLKIDLCDDKYEVHRRWLLEIGSNIHLWIQNYFVKSNHNVFVGGGDTSSTSQFFKILKSYGEDPCPERRRRQEQQ